MTAITKRQQEILEAVEACGSQRKAAEKLGLGKSTVQEAMAAIAKKGHSPAFAKHEKPAGMHAQKASVYFNEDGQPTARWLKYDRDEEEKRRCFETMVQAMEKRVEGCSPTIKRVKPSNNGVLTELPIADHHFRKLAWAPETGEDWDLAIAASVLDRGVDALLGSMDAPEKMILANLGDFAHSNNREGTTDRSGHVLDTDSRWDKAVDQMIKSYCGVIERAASWAGSVEVISIPGNHDDMTIKWLQRVMASYYRNNDNITIRVSPLNREYAEWGKCLLGWYHGDRMSPEKMAHVVAAEQAPAWGRTVFRSMHCGHLHSKKGKSVGAFVPGVQEVPGLVVEHLQSLCANDAWHVENGYIGQTRAIEAFEWHAEYGPWNRKTRTVASLGVHYA